jgi:hypothetical protein
VNVLATAEGAVTMDAENNSGLWARDGESSKGGPDVMSALYCIYCLTSRELILNVLQGPYTQFRHSNTFGHENWMPPLQATHISLFPMAQDIILQLTFI